MTRDYFHDFVFLPGSTPVMLVATADKSQGYWNRPERAQGAIFRSRDLAESWERVGIGEWMPEAMTQMVWALAQHPEDPSIVDAGLGAVSRGRSAAQESIFLTWGMARIPRQAPSYSPSAAPRRKQHLKSSPIPSEQMP